MGEPDDQLLRRLLQALIHLDQHNGEGTTFVEQAHAVIVGRQKGRHGRDVGVAAQQEEAYKCIQHRYTRSGLCFERIQLLEGGVLGRKLSLGNQALFSQPLFGLCLDSLGLFLGLLEFGLKRKDLSSQLARLSLDACRCGSRLALQHPAASLVGVLVEGVCTRVSRG